LGGSPAALSKNEGEGCGKKHEKAVIEKAKHSAVKQLFIEAPRVGIKAREKGGDSLCSEGEKENDKRSDMESWGSPVGKFQGV